MLRKEIEQAMKEKGQKSIVLVINESDELGILCSLTGGYLTDCWGHRVDRKKDIWGYIDYHSGNVGIRKPFLPSPAKWIKYKLVFNLWKEIIKFDIYKHLML